MIENDWFRWVLQEKLNDLVTYHNVVQTLLKEKQALPEYQTEPGATATLEFFERLNTANILLLSLWQAHMGSEPRPQGESIGRYKPLFERLGLNVGSLPCWTLLQDAYKVRHCLLHANGRVSFMRQSLGMAGCIGRHGGALVNDHDRMVVTPEFLRRCVVAVNDLRDLMVGGLTSASS